MLQLAWRPFAVFFLAISLMACGSGSSEGEENESRPFITTWQTDKPGGTSQDNQIRIQTVDSGADFTVDWGDGEVEENLTGSTTHTYDSPGTYTIKIYGDFPYIRHSPSNNNEYESRKLVSLDQWGDIRWRSMRSAFANAQNMIYQATDAPDLSLVTDMSSMFLRVAELNGDLNHWNLSNVSDMTCMFCDVESFNIDISQWDVSNVMGMGWMFAYIETFNADISQWDVGNVIEMRYMFNEAQEFNGNISQWNVENVTDMEGMFVSAKDFNGDVSQWDVSNVTNMRLMFGYAESFNGNISQWNVENVTDMEGMFVSAKDFNGDVSQWDVSNVANMQKMFGWVTLSTEHYDSLLQNWSTLPLESDVQFDAGNSQYSSASESARSILENTYGWSISDGGLVTP